MNCEPLTGLIAATATPLHDDGGLNRDAIGPMVDRLIESGVQGLYVCGSTGEGMSLTCQERKAVVEATIAAAAGRVPVIVQVGHNCLSDARDLAAHAAGAGADAVSATCPSYFQVADAAVLADCMSQVAAGAPELPFYYYHIPALTGSQIDVLEFLQRGDDTISNLVGMKYTTTLLHEFQSCQALDDHRFDILWGCDEMLLAGLATGARGAVGSTYNIAAPLYVQIMDAFAGGDLGTARKLQLRSVSMIEHMKAYSFHAALKQVMGMLGMPVGPCRLPLSRLSDAEVASLHQRLKRIGFFQWCGHPSDGTPA